MRKILYNYVPYRLISPFYDVELRRIPNTNPGLKNLTIMELSYSDEGSLYSFTGEKDTIVVNAKLSARAWWRTLDGESQATEGIGREIGVFLNS